jgi:hypothetical protein
MVQILIIADNTYSSAHIGVNRAPGAHRIATHLRRHGYSVEVVDYILRWSLPEFQALCERVVDRQTLYLGIGASLFFDQPQINDMLAWFRQRYPDVPIVLGGSNIVYRDIHPVDYRLDGYAENAIVTLTRVIQGLEPESSLRYRVLGDRRYVDCNGDYGTVDTSDLGIQYQESDFIMPTQSLGIETARGCIFKCAFCTYPLIGKKKLDYLRNPDNLAQELQRNYDQWGVTNYVINEDTLNDSPQKLEQLEKAISRLPFRIQFVAYARLDLILAHPHTLELLRSMGMRGVHFGIETFNSRAAKILGKSSDIQRIKDGLLWFRAQAPEINMQCSHILGLPEDTDDPWDSLAWYHTSGIDFPYFNPLYLTDVNQVINTSQFSRNYRHYGFELMTEDEIRAEYEQGIADPRDHMHIRNAIFLVHNNRNELQKLLYWKNVRTGDNYFKASRTSMRIQEAAVERKIMSWTLFEYMTLGYPIEQCRTWNAHQSGANPLPEQELVDRSQRFIADYKQKKLQHDYHKIATMTASSGSL